MKPVYLIRSFRNVPGLQLSQPMGILYLASYVRQQMGIPLRLLDMRLNRMTVDEVKAILRENPPSVVGISALSFEAQTVYDLAAMVKREFADVPVVVGGPFATTSAELVLKDDNIDYAVVGEGEETFKELLEALFGGQHTPEVPGTVVKRDGKVVAFPPRDFITDLDSLPFPAWDLLDITQYYGRTNFNRIFAHPANMTIMTSRGCPFKCAYCHNVFGFKFRARSPENVLQEIQTLYHQFGTREFLIIDDTFNLNRRRAKDICDDILSLGLKMHFSFPNGLKADVMDQELLNKLKQCGTYRICYGVESANERILNLITRRMDKEKTAQVIDWTSRESILTHGFFMFGFPTETEAEMNETIDFALKSRLHTASFFVVVPFPGTRLSKLAEQAGAQQTYIDGYYHYMDNVISEVPREKIKKMVKQAYRKFYANPWRLYNIIRLTPLNKEFIRSSLEFFSRAT